MEEHGYPFHQEIMEDKPPSVRAGNQHLRETPRGRLRKSQKSHTFQQPSFCLLSKGRELNADIQFITSTGHAM